MPATGPHQSLQALRILHAALTMSTALYGVIAFIVIKPDATFERPSDALLYVLAGVGATLLLGALPAVRRVLMPPRQRAGDGRPFDPERLARGDTLKRLRVASIVSWAMCEAVAVLGLFGAFLYRDPMVFVPFGGVAIAALVVLTPRQALFEEIARAVPDRV